MNLKNLLITIGLFIVCQTSIWFQINGQFLFEWCRKNSFILALAGVPISIISILATKYGAMTFYGNLWPQRFLGFSVGIILFSLLSYYCLGESMTLKTWICLALALCIMVVQVIMK